MGAFVKRDGPVVFSRVGGVETHNPSHTDDIVDRVPTLRVQSTCTCTSE